jgi:glucose/mannose-6-phosphate isomerase
MNDILQPLHTFKDQFSFVPTIENEENLVMKKNVVICGMGGSAISVSLLKLFFPELSVTLHNSYGLPLGIDYDNTLCIFNSYSGDTEEILDAFMNANAKGLSMAILTRGGKLLEEAKVSNTPHVVLPSIDIEPRFSIGHQLIGLLTLMGEASKLPLLTAQVSLFNMQKAEEKGKELADLLQGKNIVLYSSAELYPVTYLIKAAINEGAKVPCFVSKVPESNHNELQSFTSTDEVTSKDSFGFIIFSSPYDHIRITKRLSTMASLYSEKGFTVAEITTNHTSIKELFEMIMTGYFFATYVAIAKNINPYTTPLIQEFKKNIVH